MGHKRTCAPQNAMSALPPIATAKADMPQKVMSALPPKADMCSANRHVCFGPIADTLRPGSDIGMFIGSDLVALKLIINSNFHIFMNFQAYR
jgi:hypothetical protein